MDVNDILVFVRVAQAGSFSKAAQRLAMPVSTVSRRVAQLEEDLGVGLFIRTTRSLKITDAGQAYLEHGRKIASEVELAESIGTRLQAIPQGTLRITTTTDFGTQFLGKIVCGFLEANPRVDVDIVLTERVVDLVDEGFDLAIRMGELDDSSQVAKKIGSLDMQLYASPDYLRRHGEPAHPRDLARFDCLKFTGDTELAEWRLRHSKTGKTESNLQAEGRVATNNMTLLRDFVLAGEGIAMMPHFTCAEEVRAGHLRIVLKDWVYSFGPIHVVYPAQRFLLPKIRAFIDHLTTSCAAVEWRRGA